MGRLERGRRVDVGSVGRMVMVRRGARPACRGARAAGQGAVGEGARTVRVIAAAAVGPGAVRGARVGMALGRSRGGGGGIKCYQK